MKSKILLVGILLFSNIVNAQEKTKRESCNNLKNSIKAIPYAAFYNANYAIGIGFERQIDKKGFFSAVISTCIGIAEQTPYLKGQIPYFIQPGLVCYPFGQRRLSWGIGLSYIYYHNKDNFDNSFWGIAGNPTNVIATSHSIIIDNYAKFRINSKFNITLQYGVGQPIRAKEKTIYESIDNKIYYEKLSNFSQDSAMIGIGFNF